MSYRVENISKRKKYLKNKKILRSRKIELKSNEAQYCYKESISLVTNELSLRLKKPQVMEG